jgi:hypothetical protein
MIEAKIRLHPNINEYRSNLFRFISFVALIIVLRIVYIVFYLEKNPFLPTFPSAPVSKNLEPCVSQSWCATKIPTKSYFRFNTPISNHTRWRIAQNQAARGDPVLLQRILTFFPNFDDFLDGDIYFRSTYKLIDYFFDYQHGFEYLFRDEGSKSSSVKLKEAYGRDIVPPVYHAERNGRAPIIMTGYEKFSTENDTAYFDGERESGKEVMVGRGYILHDYLLKEKQIHHPFILISVFNENWGMFSTLFPNRTVEWTPCCGKVETQRLQQMLSNDKLLLWFVNQHSNFTHPKIISLPRGLPIHEGGRNRQRIWDTMRLQSTEQKTSLLFTASSNWKFRPRIKGCIAKKFMNEEEEVSFLGYDDSEIGRIDEEEYYFRLSNARLCIALPGLGYDTFR